MSVGPAVDDSFDRRQPLWLSAAVPTSPLQAEVRIETAHAERVTEAGSRANRKAFRVVVLNCQGEMTERARAGTAGSCGRRDWGLCLRDCGESARRRCRGFRKIPDGRRSRREVCGQLATVNDAMWIR